LVEALVVRRNAWSFVEVPGWLIEISTFGSQARNFVVNAIMLLGNMSKAP
jgi:hypothetical protein